MKLKIKSIEGMFYTIDISLKKASEGCKNPCGDTLHTSQPFQELLDGSFRVA